MLIAIVQIGVQFFEYEEAQTSTMFAGESAKGGAA